MTAFILSLMLARGWQMPQSDFAPRYPMPTYKHIPKPPSGPSIR